MSIVRGGGVGSPLLAWVLGTRARSNFHPLCGSANRGGATSASPAFGGFSGT